MFLRQRLHNRAWKLSRGCARPEVWGARLHDLKFTGSSPPSCYRAGLQLAAQLEELKWEKWSRGRTETRIFFLSFARWKSKNPGGGGPTEHSGNSEKWETMIRILGTLKLFVLCCLLSETKCAIGNKHTHLTYLVYIFFYYYYFLVSVEVFHVSVNWFPGNDVYGVTVEWVILGFTRGWDRHDAHYWIIYLFPSLRSFKVT